MRRIFVFLLLATALSSSLHAQLEVVKMLGKNSKNAKLGYGVFAYWDFPVGEDGNRSIMIELMDLAFFARKDASVQSPIAYLSIKAGYKYIFSEEGKTGFYVEPSAGYCRVVNSEEGDHSYGDGVALAGEVGYSLEVGQRDNTLNFGVKYETDLAGDKNTISTIALKVAYSFHLFRKRGN